MIEDIENDTFRTEEDKIIESLVIDTTHRLFDDSDFLPIRQSLYNIENVIPLYDDESSPNILWCRPQVITPNPVYFTRNSQLGVIQGNLPDEIFIGALLAVCSFPKYDLMENIFSSRPEDFKSYGVFTCRFYVEGDWVEVITDTNIPCLRDNIKNEYTPIYSRSIHSDEMWISLAEKAYAKAVGSYEAIPRVRIHEALMHLTGGSVQQTNMIEDSSYTDSKAVWNILKGHLDDTTLILVQPISPDLDETKDGNGDTIVSQLEILSISPTKKIEHSFKSHRFYSIVSYREIDDLYLLLIHNPWHHSIHHHPNTSANTTNINTSTSSTHNLSLNHSHSYSHSNSNTSSNTNTNSSSNNNNSNQGECWHGAWGNKSSYWDKYPDILKEVQHNLSVSWNLSNPNGYFWITCQDFQNYFNTVYYCKLFPTSSYKFYCIKDEWKEKQAGGGLVTVRDKTVAQKDALESKRVASTKASIVTVIDGDSSWFNNPQIRIHATKQAKAYISCLPLSADKDGSGLAVGMDIIATKKSIGGMANDQLHIWDSVLSDFVASDKVDGNGRVKGQESSVWAVDIDPNHNYHVIAHTMKRGQDGYYLLRIFSTEALVVEQIPSVYFTSLHSDWHRSHDMDSTGGPLHITHENQKKENPKWCQNPQFHLELQDLFSKDDLKLKIVIRRTDKATAASHHRNGIATNTDKSNHESFVGMVVCRSDCLQENVLKNKLKKQPRLTAVGELIPAKTSTLRKPSSNQYEQDNNPLSSSSSSNINNNNTNTQFSGLPLTSDVTARKDTFDITQVPRKYSILNEPHVFETSYSSRTEACIYISKISRSLIPQGLVIIPSLHDKGIKGTFELEVYSSEPIVLKQLPDTYNKSMGSEWTEQNAVGSHINPNWKKNPKFSFHFRHTSRNLTNNTRIPIRISLARHGNAWKAMTKKDMVGCMIGFYIFIQRNNELVEQIYESVFVSNDELCTESGFTLTPLPIGEEYIIMPATCAEGKIGSFVLTIMTEAEFKFHKEKA